MTNGGRPQGRAANGVGMGSLSIGVVLLRLAVATAAGLAIGFERERREKAAGLRTLALVSSGSAILVLGAVAAAPAEAIRMAAGIATGVGFLGAGAIMRDRGAVIGLTTAATVWIAAALGISAALGEFALTAAGAVVTLLLLAVLGMVDLSRVRQDARTYEVTYREPAWEEEAARRCLIDAGLRVSLSSISWSQEGAVVTWHVEGLWEHHERATVALQQSPSVVSFTVRI